MTNHTITVRLRLDPAQQAALTRITRAAQELTDAIGALSPLSTPRWAADPDDPRRITNASDATAAPEPSAAPDTSTDIGQGASGPQNGTQPDQLLALHQLRSLCITGEARRIRESRRLTVAEIAQTVGVSHTAVSRWERGLRTPRGGAALRYAKLLQALDHHHPKEPVT